MRVAFLAWIVASRAPRLRVPLAIVVAVIAFARVYLAASWAADVAGGILLGIAVAALAELVGERLATGQRAPRAALATPVAR
jgi:membrane-associated phospholipid phosphatase